MKGKGFTFGALMTPQDNESRQSWITAIVATACSAVNHLYILAAKEDSLKSIAAQSVLSVTLGIAGIFAGKVYQRSKLLLRER